MGTFLSLIIERGGGKLSCNLNRVFLLFFHIKIDDCSLSYTVLLLGFMSCRSCVILCGYVTLANR